MKIQVGTVITAKKFGVSLAPNKWYEARREGTDRYMVNVGGPVWMMVDSIDIQDKMGADLTERLETLLHHGVQFSGSYKADDCLVYIGEELTLEETETVESFLNWLVANHKTFGHNLPTVWAEWQATL